jgi:hypothetical protein
MEVIIACLVPVALLGIVITSYLTHKE